MVKKGGLDNGSKIYRCCSEVAYVLLACTDLALVEVLCWQHLRIFRGKR